MASLRAFVDAISADTIIRNPAQNTLGLKYSLFFSIIHDLHKALAGRKQMIKYCVANYAEIKEEFLRHNNLAVSSGFLKHQA